MSVVREDIADLLSEARRRGICIVHLPGRATYALHDGTAGNKALADLIVKLDMTEPLTDDEYRALEALRARAHTG